MVFGHIFVGKWSQSLSLDPISVLKAIVQESVPEILSKLSFAADCKLHLV